MTFDIKIKGFQDLMRIEDVGEGLLERWKLLVSKKIPDEPVSVKGWSGFLSDIRSFKRVQDSRSNNNVSEQSHAEYVADRKKILNMSIEERSKRLGFFRIVYFGFTQKMSEYVKTLNGVPIEDIAIDIQKKFFTEHPRRIFCDVIEFKPIIKSDKCDSAVMRIIENQIRQDIFAEKNIK